MTDQHGSPPSGPGQDPGAAEEAALGHTVAPPPPAWRRRQSLGWWWILPIGIAVAFVLLVQGELREFGYAVGGALGVAGLIRLVLPRESAGGLVVRSRWLDVVCLWGLGLAVAFLAASLRIR